MSMITPKMRLRMMTLIRMKKRRSYTTRKKKLGSCTTRGPSGMDKGVEDSIRVNEGCTGEGRSMNSRRVGGRETEDGRDRGR